MNYKLIFAILLLITLPCKKSHGQDSTRAHLKDNIIPIVDLNSNWNFLDSLIGDKKYVFLGEANHGDGATLKAKEKFIKYLSEKLDFKVLVLERSFYEMNVLNTFLRNGSGKDSHYFMIEALRKKYDFFSEYEKDYFQTAYKNQMKIAGVDLGYGSWFSNQIESDLIKCKIDKKTIKKYISKLSIVNRFADTSGFNSFKTDFSEFINTSYTLISSLSKTHDVEDETIEFLLQTIKSNLGLAQWIMERPIYEDERDDIQNNLYHTVRDKYMAQNLLWLISIKYPQSKFIISTSTYHISQNLFNHPVMVDYLPDSIREKSYFIPFVTYQGLRGYDTTAKLFELTEFKRDSLSLEYLLQSFNLKYAFLDFESISVYEREIIDKHKMFPSTNSFNWAKWSSCYNGVFFIQTMEPDFWKPITLMDDEYLRKVLYNRR